MSDEHETYFAQSEATGTWRWSCETCQWTGWGCPSLGFAIQEHTFTVADIARRNYRPAVSP